MPNETPKDIQTRIRVRDESRPLWDAIKSAKGWTFSEAAHRVAARFCEVEGIDVQTTPPAPRRRRRVRSAA